MGTGSVSKVELEWDDVFSGNFPETPARQAWRDAVQEVAERAKTALPACNGRVERAVALVLNGDVELLPECKDFPRAPESFCLAIRSSGAGAFSQRSVTCSPIQAS